MHLVLPYLDPTQSDTSSNKSPSNPSETDFYGYYYKFLNTHFPPDSNFKPASQWAADSPSHVFGAGVGYNIQGALRFRYSRTTERIKLKCFKSLEERSSEVVRLYEGGGALLVHTKLLVDTCACLGGTAPRTNQLPCTVVKREHFSSSTTQTITMAVTHDFTSAPKPKNGSSVRFGRVESSSSAPSILYRMTPAIRELILASIVRSPVDDRVSQREPAERVCICAEKSRKLDSPWSVAPPDILLRGELFVLKNFCQCQEVMFAEFAYDPQRKTSSSQAFSFIHDAASRHLPTASINDTAVAPLSERTPKTSTSRSSHATYVDVNLFRDVLAKSGDRLGQLGLDGMAFENV
ncbi:hypothetical protein F5J12DRAFT_782967 [Pisolithus orientalis]|uniref:uncharacterized protein n=1 Tax=Pisolithus orientalis TaxID=936130 RepID=UPI002224DE1E|nr:uncharacterized protein F5J12DRAFT_782967 [Pisolithus orientalis]KAI6006180.1 hypothetical protein F5J12DRAFT_782967 [Pisolithus orientalis]